MPKKLYVSTLMDSQRVKVSETLLYLHGSIFVMFSNHSERKSARKILF